MSVSTTTRVCQKYDRFSEDYDRWDAEHRSISRQRRERVRGLKGSIPGAADGHALRHEQGPLLLEKELIHANQLEALAGSTT